LPVRSVRGLANRLSLRNGLGKEIQDDLEPPIGLVANLNGDAAKVAFGAQENRKVDALSGRLVHSDKVRFEKILIGVVPRLRWPNPLVLSEMHRRAGHARPTKSADSIVT
jgi:hypothetical protein